MTSNRCQCLGSAVVPLRNATLRPFTFGCTACSITSGSCPSLRSGNSVAVGTQGVIAVGAPFGSTGGAVYVYLSTSSVAAETVLQMPSPVAGDGYGTAVVAAQGMLFASSPSLNWVDVWVPVAQTFLTFQRRATCPQLWPATPCTRNPFLGGDDYGAAMAATPTFLAISAPGVNRRGSVVVYPSANAVSTANMTINLPVTIATASNRFGTSLALAGPWLAVGCTVPPSVFVYQLTINGQLVLQQPTLHAQLALTGESLQLGRAVALAHVAGVGTFLAATAASPPGTNLPLLPQVVLYQLVNANWLIVRRLSGSGSDATFGTALALSPPPATTIFVGSPATNLVETFCELIVEQRVVGPNETLVIT